MFGSSTVLVGGLLQVLTSAGSSRLNTSDWGSPMAWSPRGSKKKAPTVSLLPTGCGNGLFLMIPASCSPELKMYWSGVPLGQKPPPPTGDPANATHTSPMLDRKSTRLNSSHSQISYAVFCLKK